MYIVIEGVDGAGKTTIAKEIERISPFRYWKHLNGPEHKGVNKLVPGLNDAAEEFVTARLLREFGTFDSIVQDRGFWSANVYWNIKGVRGTEPEATEHYWKECLPEKTLYVLLTRPIDDCRRERFSWDKLREIEAAFNFYYKECPLREWGSQTLNLPAKTVIGNGGAEPEFVAKKILGVAYAAAAGM